MQSIKTPRDLPHEHTPPPPPNPRAPDEGRRVTKKEYWANWYQTPYPHIDVSYEWINGILQAKSPSNYSQIEGNHQNSHVPLSESRRAWH